jgi:hypothetical protein
MLASKQAGRLPSWKAGKLERYSSQERTKVRGYALIAECGIRNAESSECGMLNAECGMNIKGKGVRRYEGTKALPNAECGVRNAESSECGMLNAECGMNIKGKGVRRYEGTKALPNAECGVRNAESTNGSRFKLLTQCGMRSAE